jgi:hypothetical protein
MNAGPSHILCQPISLRLATFKCGINGINLQHTRTHAPALCPRSRSHLDRQQDAVAQLELLHLVIATARVHRDCSWRPLPARTPALTRRPAHVQPGAGRHLPDVRLLQGHRDASPGRRQAVADLLGGVHRDQLRRECRILPCGLDSRVLRDQVPRDPLDGPPSDQGAPLAWPKRAPCLLAAPADTD